MYIIHKRHRKSPNILGSWDQYSSTSTSFAPGCHCKGCSHMIASDNKYKDGDRWGINNIVVQYYVTCLSISFCKGRVTANDMHWKMGEEDFLCLSICLASSGGQKTHCLEWCRRTVPVTNSRKWDETPVDKMKQVHANLPMAISESW